MAKGMCWKLAALVLLLTGFLVVTPSMGQVDRVGTLGDSITDLENPPGLTNYFPWTRWSAEVVGVNFGAYASWPDFRGPDYQYNYAHGGATTATMISDGQHTLLAAENPIVNVAILLNGANDLAYHFQNHALWVYLQDGQNPSVIVPGMTTNCNTAITTVAGAAGSPTGTNMVIFGCADITRMPKIKDNLWAAWPGSATKYRNAAATFSTNLSTTAASRHFVYLNLRGLQESIMGTPGSPKSNFTLCGVTISMTNMFYSDGIHPGPVFTGIVANMVNRALNLKYGTTFTILSNEYILTSCGYSPTAGETYYNVDPYIVLNN
jgi:hypothetical protein